MTSRALFTLTAVSALLVACSSSSNGETSDAGHANDAGSHDATSADTATFDAGHDAGIDAPPQPVFSADAGSTWTALYRDYFGNDTAVHTAGCSNGTFCHGSTTEQGSYSGYLCPKGDKEACYKSFTAQDAGAAQIVTPDAGWESDYLSSLLCEVDDAGTSLGGSMPYDCPYNFTPTDIDRIKAWVAAGYPDD